MYKNPKIVKQIIKLQKSKPVKIVNKCSGVLSEGKRGLLNAMNQNEEIKGFEDARALDIANEKRPTAEMKKSRKK